MADSIPITVKLNEPTMLLKRIPRRQLSNDKYSVIFLTKASRASMISNAIDPILINNTKLDKIYVYFNDFDTSAIIPDEMIKVVNKYNGKVEIYDTIYRTLPSRFLIPDTLRTKYIFSIDDDFKIKPVDANRVFDFYLKKKLQGRIVGDFRRLCTGPHYYACPTHDYNMILTGLALFTVDLLQYYNYDKYDDLRATAARNCEDLLMNFIARTNTGLPPVYVEIPKEPINYPGMSWKGNHYAIRDACCGTFESKLGKMLGNGGHYILKNGTYVRQS